MYNTKRIFGKLMLNIFRINLINLMLLLNYSGIQFTWTIIAFVPRCCSYFCYLLRAYGFSRFQPTFGCSVFNWKKNMIKCLNRHTLKRIMIYFCFFMVPTTTITPKKGPEFQLVPYDQIIILVTWRTLAMNGYITSCAPFNFSFNY